jgi:hypothetical protein
MSLHLDSYDKENSVPPIKQRKYKKKVHSEEIQVNKKQDLKEKKGKSFTRRLWNKEEDNVILKLVKEYGTKKWTLISKKLQEVYKIYGRSGKQCRERYDK